MADMHEIVNLCAVPHHGGIYGGAVYAHMSADFYVVAQNYVADLRHFLVNAVVGGEAEPICADNRCAVNYAIFADYAIFANCGGGIDSSSVTDFGKLPDIGVGVNRRVVANLGVVVNNGKGHNGRVLADFDVFSYMRLGANLSR